MRLSLKEYHEILRLRKKIHDYEDKKKSFKKENRDLETAIKKIQERGKADLIDELNDDIEENTQIIEELDRKINAENKELDIS